MNHLQKYAFVKAAGPLPGAGGNLAGGTRIVYPTPAWEDWKRHNYDPRYAPRRSVWPKGTAGEHLTHAPRPGRWPSVSRTQDIYNMMYGVNPEQLGDVLVEGGPHFQQRSFERGTKNERTGWLFDLLRRSTYEKYRDQLKSNEATVDYVPMGPFYEQYSNMVSQPWADPPALIHELGHAIDMNSSMLGNERMDPDSTRAKARALLRDAYIEAPYTTLWKEHAAWRKGIESYLEGSAKEGLTWDDIEKTIQDVVKGKYPALASYWGQGTAEAGGNIIGGTLAYGLWKRWRGQDKMIDRVGWNKPPSKMFLRSRAAARLGTVGGIGYLASKLSAPVVGKGTHPMAQGAAGMFDKGEAVADIKKDFETIKRRK